MNNKFEYEGKPISKLENNIRVTLRFDEKYKAGLGFDELIKLSVEEMSKILDDKIRENNAILGAITQSDKPIIKLRNGTEIDRHELINSLEIKKIAYEELNKEVLTTQNE